MFNTEEKPRFNLYQRKLMSEPAPDFGQAIGQEEVIVDETPQETVVDVNTKPKVDKDKFLGGVFDQRPKVPVYNTSSEQQNKAMMKAQAIGNLLALVGDVGGVAMGANVAKRQSKPLEPYMAAIQRKREQFEKDSRVFEKEDWLNKLRKAQGEASVEAKAEQAAYDRGQDISKDKTKAEERAYERSRDTKKDKFEQKKFETDKEFKARTAGLSEKKQSEDVRQFNETLEFKKASAAADRAIKKQAAKIKASGKPFMKINIDNKETDVKEGTFRQLFREALADDEPGANELLEIEAKLGTIPMEGMKRVVEEYIQRKGIDPNNLPEENAKNSKIDPSYKGYKLPRISRSLSSTK